MNRQFTDHPFYRDFRDLAKLVLATDCVATVLFMVLWHL